jgi:hypothetical protein
LLVFLNRSIERRKPKILKRVGKTHLTRGVYQGFMLEIIKAIADNFEVVANLCLVGVVWQHIDQSRYVTITFSLGSFRMRKKDVTLPNVTGIVSQTYFGGGWLPDNIRHEVLLITNPSVKDVVINNQQPVETGVNPTLK